MADEVTLDDYQYPTDPTWCPGCGDFAILRSVKASLVDLGLAPHESLLVSGIGCGSKLPHYMNVNGYHSIHGRPVPVATGAKLANPDLNVVVTAGDGDSYGIGGNHFLHACRRNIGITHIVEDNRVYGLTKGQYSPTSHKGFVTKTSPEGSIEPPVRPVPTALTSGATFIARTFSGHVQTMNEIFAAAMDHDGYALVDVLQPCVTFNPGKSYDFYNDLVYELDEDYDPTDREAAEEKAKEWGDRIPLGVIYREDRPTYEEQVPALQDGPVAKRSLDPEERSGVDLEEVKKSFM
ncbi:2-oxoacid:ferredoxin oxidoreductase subunit beta [Candidatus Bipolaricaulota bacterium]|nr:2-oxoacid:ferredoxin oxidoreductase subunit beta [Candidatus Bipolaricaulota bacterium]